MELAQIPVNEIVHSRFSNGHSRGYSAEMFEELSKSVMNMGVKNPICVTRKNAEGFHVVIDGDHRLEAARAAGIRTVPALIDPAVDPDAASTDEKVLNYISNMQRVNLSVCEAAVLFRQMCRDCSFEQIEEVKARMGLSKHRVSLFGKLNKLDDETFEILSESGITVSPGVADALLSVRDPQARADALSRALMNGIRDSREIAEFVECVGVVRNQFPPEVCAHFNGRELPFSKKIASFLMLYPTAEGQLAAVKKLNGIPPKERTAAAAEFVRLLDGADAESGRRDAGAACPELKQMVLTDAFPYDRALISAIIRFRDLFPESGEKRRIIISDLLKRECLTEDDLIRLTRSLERFFFAFPEEVRDFFWRGCLGFSDCCFRILDILLAKSYDLPTKLEMIGAACEGCPSPEQFENRLAKAIRDRDEMIRDVALQTDTDPELLQNDEDIMRTAGIPEADIARISAARKRDRSCGMPGPSGPARLIPAGSPAEAEIPYGDSRPEDSDYLMLADSMARSQETEKHVELELLQHGENETIRLSRLYRTADRTCRKCRSERIFGFDTVNYCFGCMLAALISEIEDSVGED